MDDDLGFSEISPSQSNQIIPTPLGLSVSYDGGTSMVNPWKAIKVATKWRYMAEYLKLPLQLHEGWDEQNMGRAHQFSGGTTVTINANGTNGNVIMAIPINSSRVRMDRDRSRSSNQYRYQEASGTYRKCKFVNRGHIGLHPAEDCNRRKWLNQNGIEPNPGPTW